MALFCSDFYMEKTNFQWRGWSLALVATVLWSGNFVIARGLADLIPPVSLAFFRWLLAVVVLFPFAARKVWQDRHIIVKHRAYLTLTGMIGIAIYGTLIYFAGQTTEAMNLSLIAISAPVYILFLSRIIFGQALTTNRLTGTLITLSGILFLLTDGKLATLTSMSFTIGDLWMVIAAMLWACYTLLIKVKPAEISQTTFQFSTFSVGVVMLLPVYLWEASVMGPVVWSKEIYWALFYVGVLSSLIAFSCWSIAVSEIGPTKSGFVYYLVPLFSGLAAAIWLGEDITVTKMVSMLLIVGGIIIANTQFRFNRLFTSGAVESRG